MLKICSSQYYCLHRKPLLAITGVSIGAIVISLLINTIALSQTSTLKIGDKFPEVTLSNTINHSSDKLSFKDFRGKLVIIDFWATWCGPCVAAMPKTDSLQQAFKDQVQFVAVTYQKREEVQNLLGKLQARKGFKPSFPFVTTDSVLHDLFPHRELPHYIWVNAEGTIIATTGLNEINTTQVRAVLAKEKNTLEIKEDVIVPYNSKEPLISGNQCISDKKLMYQSALTGYIDGLPSQYTSHPVANGVKRITITNTVLKFLYTYAYASGRAFSMNRVFVEVKDPSPFTTSATDNEYKQWLRDGHAFSYEVIVPAEQEEHIFSIMRQGMERYFPQYRATMSKRMMPCLALVRTSDKDIRTKSADSKGEIGPFSCTMQNKKLSWLAAWLRIKWLQHLKTPVVDMTGYSEPVDLAFNAEMSNVESLRKALQPFGLDLVEMESGVEVLVIKDAVDD